MSEKLAWGILGTGAIAKAFARGVAKSKSCTLAAVASRRQVAADEFGEEHHIARRHGSYETLLSDPQVSAVYIALPHHVHAEWAIKAAEAKKHVLVEKPIGLSPPRRAR